MYGTWKNIHKKFDLLEFTICELRLNEEQRWIGR